MRLFSRSAMAAQFSLVYKSVSDPDRFFQSSGRRDFNEYGGS